MTEISDGGQWDGELLALPHTHPLQCWAWGLAKEAQGETVLRLAARREGRPVALAQVFLKRASRLRFPVAWIPRGPVIAGIARGAEPVAAAAALRREIAARGPWLLVAAPYLAWRGVPPAPFGRRIPGRAREATFLLDLEQPLEELERRLHKEWRYGKNRFYREGGQVVEDRSDDAVEPLIRLGLASARRKGFALYGGAEAIRAVWRAFRACASPAADAYLFRAEIAGRCAAAALILRVGASAHYVWGAFDYDARSSRPNEGLQWKAILRLREMGVRRYDLEGADRRANPGVFEFKRRMGGELVTLPPTVWAPLLRRFYGSPGKAGP